MTRSKDHWYDGRFYDKFIAPNQDKTFEIIQNIIPSGCKFLDVGCGTGRLAFQISSKCEEIVGVEISLKNLSIAQSKLNELKLENIRFEHIDAVNLKDNLESDFDYASLTYVIHEVDRDSRIELLNSIKAVSNRIIIADYLYPHPNSFWGNINKVVEFLAGKTHFKNFRTFLEDGGLRGLAENAGFKIVQEEVNKPQTSHLVVLE